MTTRRVNIGLTYATDHDPSDLLADILQRLKGIGADLTGTNVHAFDLDEDDDSPAMYRVFGFDDDQAVPTTHYTDLDRADGYARHVNGVVVELPVIADYRKPTAEPKSPAGHDSTFCVLCQNGGHSAQPEPLVDPDCAAGKCSSCVGGPCEHHCHGGSV